MDINHNTPNIEFDILKEDFEILNTFYPKIEYDFTYGELYLDCKPRIFLTLPAYYASIIRLTLVISGLTDRLTSTSFHNEKTMAEIKLRERLADQIMQRRATFVGSDSNVLFLDSKYTLPLRYFSNNIGIQYYYHYY